MLHFFWCHCKIAFFFFLQLNYIIGFWSICDPLRYTIPVSIYYCLIWFLPHSIFNPLIFFLPYGNVGHYTALWSFWYPPPIFLLSSDIMIIFSLSLPIYLLTTFVTPDQYSQLFHRHVQSNEKFESLEVHVPNWGWMRQHTVFSFWTVNKCSVFLLKTMVQYSSIQCSWQLYRT